MSLLWGISPLMGQEIESGSPNETPGTGQLISSFPNQLSGEVTGSDIDFWNIPDGTSGNFQLADIFFVNFLFGSTEVELQEYSNSARTSGLVSQSLSESDEFTLDGSKFYSLRVSSNSGTPTVAIPNTITSYSDLLILVSSTKSEIDNIASQLSPTPLLIFFLQIGLNFLEDEIIDEINDGGINLAPGIVTIVENVLQVAINNPINLYTLTFIQSSGSSGNSGALPVVWADFSANLVSAQVKLLWSTASEQNNSGFSIEYSQDALNWESLGFVEGNGTATELNTYTFVHDRPHWGFNYYRLKQIDYNGDFEYSEIREVIQQGETSSTAFQVYPNPTVDLIQISPLVGRLFLRDLTGKILQERQVQGSWSQLDLSSYPSGVYLLQLYPTKGSRSSFSIQKN